MRKMNKKEISLVSYLISLNHEKKYLINNIAEMNVEDSPDGGMGSLIFSSNKKDRKLGSDLSSFEFNDLDGVKVIVNLVLDNYGDLYELDIWKTDFSSLISLPDIPTNF